MEKGEIKIIYFTNEGPDFAILTSFLLEVVLLIKYFLGKAKAAKPEYRKLK